MIGPEIVEFSQALKEAFNYGELEILLRGMNKNLTDFVSATAPFPTQTAQVVAAANQQGWIAEFVRAVVAARSTNAHIQSFLAANAHWDPANNPPPAHPCETLFIYGGKCFIARPQLREFLKKMDSPTGERVLVVTSDHRKVGKTYSKELVIFVSNNRPPSGVAYVDLDESDYGPGTLADALSRQMEVPAVPMPPQDLQQPARWNKELVAWLLSPAANGAAPKVWWIILDGFRQKVPSEAIQAFISELAEKVQGTERFRLIVVDFNYRFPLGIRAFVLNDEVKPLTREEVGGFLAEIHRQQHHTEPSESDLTEYVDGCYDRLALYVQQNPEFSDNQLLLNMAVRDAVTAI